MNSSMSRFQALVSSLHKIGNYGDQLGHIQFKKACVVKPSGVEHSEMQKLFRCLFI